MNFNKVFFVFLSMLSVNYIITNINQDRIKYKMKSHKWNCTEEYFCV